MENDHSKLFIGFLLGAAAGAIAGYLLAGGKKEDLITDIKTGAGKIKDEFGKRMQQGEDLLDELTREAGDLFNETRSN